MWCEILQMFLLAQTEQEKMITRYGLIFLALFVGVLVLDSFSKGKRINTKGPLKKILLVIFILLVLLIILLNNVYK